MAEMTKVHEVPYEGDNFVCPACMGRIQIVAEIEVQQDKSSVRQNGENGFHNFVYSVNLKTKILKFKINHECVPKEQDR